MTDSNGSPGATDERKARDGSDLSGYLSPTHLGWLHHEPDRAWRELDATLVFGDVSGFTALGERLARRGRVGSETLTEAITSVFIAKRKAIRKEGGEIVKFGGDAVLAMFSGPDHAARGAAAAVGMQEALGALRIPGSGSTGGGLKMTVGVASGIAHLFLAGREPREMIVAGPLASEVVGCEGMAEAGETLVSASTAAGLPAACLTKSGRRGVRLLVARPPTMASDGPAPPPGADPGPGLPPHMRNHQPDLGEHRAVTIGFIQFKGSDSVLAEQGPEALSEALDQIVGAAAKACRDWEVALVSSDVDRDGGKLILSAGAPVASPDDDDRMLHAVRDVVSRPWPLEVRAGVNRGPVFSADIGIPARRVWSLMGDAVNLAARVMGHAKPGEVLATPTVLARTRDDFKPEPVEPFAAKGKSALVKASIVGDPSGSRARDPVATPLVGRSAELGELSAAIEAARGGERRVIELVGEPGIGKSRLVGAVRERSAGMVELSIQGGPYGARTPYLAVRRGLRSILLPEFEGNEDDLAAPLAARITELEPRLEAWLPLIGTAFGVDYPATPTTRALSSEHVQARTVGALGRLIDVAAPAQPLLILIEDAHWLDGASIGLLEYLLAQTRDQYSADTPDAPGYFAMVTRRPGRGELEGINDMRSIELEPLDPDAIRELLRPDSEEAATLSPELRERLVERAHGNPLLLGELVAAAQSGRAIDELPDSVEALMNARMDTLPHADRRILREASVLGNEFSVPLLAQIAGRDDDAVRAALSRLSEFVAPVRSDTARFSHALLHDAAYAALPFRRRRELHAKAGEILRTGGGDQLAEILAIHFSAARRWPEAWHYGRIAGERALERAAPREAAGFLRSAVTAARWVSEVERSELARITTLLGEAAELAGSYDEARKAFAKARKLIAGDPVAEAELFLKEGRLREGAATLSEALRYYTRGLNAVGTRRSSGARSIRARLDLAKAATRLRGGRHREALPLLERAVDEAERAKDRATLGHAYYLLDWAHTDLGNPEAEHYRDMALPIFEEIGDYDKQGRVLTNLGVNAYHEGRWTEALEFYERATESSERAGDSIGAAFNLNNIAEIRIEQGHLDEAEALLREILGSWRAAGFAAGIGTVLLNLGRVEMRRGNLERAGELFSRGRETLAEIGAEGLVCELDAFEAKRTLLVGDHEAAIAIAEEIGERARRIDVIPAVPAILGRVIGLALVKGGDAQLGIEKLHESAVLAREVDALYDEALAFDALAQIDVGSDGRFRARADEIFEHLGVVTPPLVFGSGPARPT